MTKERLQVLLDHGIEIEFEYNGIGYYIGWSDVGDVDDIVFCQFNDDLVQSYRSLDELWMDTYKGIPISRILTEGIQEDYYSDL